MKSQRNPQVLFVCLGNICRSPLAETVFKKMATERGLEMTIESRGIGDWFIGHLADPRTRDSALRRGYVVATRARLFTEEDFTRFDYILVADNKVLSNLTRRAELVGYQGKIHLMTAFTSFSKDQEVPDPFYQGDAAFDLVLDLIEDSCQTLLEHLITQHFPDRKL